MRPRSIVTSSSPAVGIASPAQSRSSVVLPDPFGPVTSRNPSWSTSNSTPRSTRLCPYRFCKPRARIIARTLDLEQPWSARSGGPGQPAATTSASLDSDLREHEDEEGDADHAVHREERSIEPTEVIWTNERMLVGKEQRDRGNSKPVQPAELEADAGPRQQGDGQDVEKPRSPESACHSEPD